MRISTIFLSLLLIVLLFGFATAESFWPVFQHDTGHTGVAPVSTAPELESLWVADGYMRSGSHLALGCDGTLWAVARSVRRYSRQGEVISNLTAGDLGFIGEFKGRGSPAVLADGTLIAMAGVRNDDGQFIGTLCAVQPDEDVRWTLPFEGQTDVHSLITLGPDGQIYVGCPTSLYAVSQEGSIVWSYECDAQILTVPAVANDGSVYFGAGNSTLYCLTPEGLLNWTFRPEGPESPLDSAPTLGDDGRVYFAVSRNGLYCLNSDGSVEFSYPFDSFCYTSPILMADASVVFYEKTESGLLVARLNADGTKRWGTLLPTDQTPGSSPAADQDGNVFVNFRSWDASTGAKRSQFGRVDSDGAYTPLCSEITPLGESSGPCIGADGSIYCHVGTKTVAFGKRQGRTIGIKTNSPRYAAWLGFWVTVSVAITNAELDTPLDCYIAYKPVSSDQMLFYPFWSPDPTLAAMQFRPLPGDAFFEKIEIAHIPSNLFPTGDYQLFAAFFEPDTFNLIGEIGSCTFSVHGSQIPDDTRAAALPSTAQKTFKPEQTGTPPTISIWTNKDTYLTGEVLDLSVGFDNEGMGVGYDLYIAATMDADPNGTLFFFPTWANDPMLTAISFQPLPQGASLPDLTIMHLELWDGLPAGDYRFLAAFFVTGTFELASEIAEVRWTLM